MKIFISLSAKENLDDYSWSVYNNEREYTVKAPSGAPINHRHPEVTFKKGDIFGTRTTRVNTVYLLKADAVHIPYVLPVAMKREYDILMKRSMPYVGPPIDYDEIESGFTRNRRRLNTTTTPNRQTADYFWREKEPDEKVTIDKDNYQWRKINTGTPKIPVITKGQGRVKFHLLPGYIVGVRFFNNSRGGYVLYGKDRVQIRRENYDDIIQNSRVLPQSEQQSGVIDRETGANDVSEAVNATEERGRRVRKSELDNIAPEDALVPKYNTNPDLSMEKTRRSSRRAQTTQLLQTIFNVDDLASLVSKEVVGDFEEDDETQSAPQQEAAPAKPAKKEPAVKAPKATLPKEFEDDEGEYYSGDDVEEEEEDTGNLPKDGSDDAHAPVIDALIPGVIFTVLATKRKFAIIFSEPYESATGKVLDVTKLTLHEIGDESVLYKVNVKNTMTEAEFAQVARIEPDDLPDNTLGKMQRNMEYLDIKPVALGKTE